MCKIKSFTFWTTEVKANCFLKADLERGSFEDTTKFEGRYPWVSWFINRKVNSTGNVRSLKFFEKKRKWLAWSSQYSDRLYKTTKEKDLILLQIHVQARTNTGKQSQTGYLQRYCLRMCLRPPGCRKIWNFFKTSEICWQIPRFPIRLIMADFLQ